MTCLQAGARRRMSPRHHSWPAHAPLRSPIRRAQPNRTALGGRTCNEQRHDLLMHHPSCVSNNQTEKRQRSAQSTSVLTLRESFDSSAAALRDGAISPVDVRDKLFDEYVAPHSLLCCVPVPKRHTCIRASKSHVAIERAMMERLHCRRTQYRAENCNETAVHRWGRRKWLEGPFLPPSQLRCTRPCLC